MTDPTLVVIGQDVIDTSLGPLAVGEYARLPAVEAIHLAALHKVLLADWKEQQAPAEPPARGRYRRRDLRADP